VPQASESTAPEGPPFETREGVLRWLEHHGLAHLAYVNIEVLAPLLDPSSWPALHAAGKKRYLTDFAAAQTCARVLPLMPAGLRTELPPAVLRFIAQERDRVTAARDEIPGRLAATVPPEVEPVRQRILELRQRFPATIAPRLQAEFDAKSLRFDAAKKRWTYKDPWPTRLPGGSQRFGSPAVVLVLAGNAFRHECTCGATYCVHGLAAIDAVLLWLRSPHPKAATLFAELDEPDWVHALAALERAISADTVERAGVRVEWRVTVDDDRIEIRPWLARLGKNDRLGVARPVTPRALRCELGPKLEAVDARIAALVPEPGIPAPASALEALIGHPRVFRDEAPDRPLHVTRAPVGLLAEERPNGLWITVALEGSPLPAPLLGQLEASGPGDLLFVDEGPRLTLLEVGDEIRAMTPVLRRQGHLFPPESRTELLASLSRWAERIPVAMPESVMGIAVPPDNRLVLRLQAHANGAVHIAVRVRPLRGGPSFDPGQGMRVVYIRREGRPYHARRDFAAEATLAAGLLADFELQDGEALERGVGRRVEHGRDVLAILALAQRLEPPPELEWEGRPIRALPAPGPGSLRLHIGRNRNWFGMLGELSVAGERVELARLLDAARRHERHVKVDAYTYIEITEALGKHLEHLADHAQDDAHGLRIGVSGVPCLLALESAGALVEADTAWRELTEKVAAAKHYAPSIPSDLDTPLRPYQRAGFVWMMRLAAWGVGGILADDMGLGKTIQALAVLLARRDEGPALVLSPTSVAYHWLEEGRRYASALRFHEFGALREQPERIAGLGPKDVLVVTYGLLARHLSDLESLTFSTAIFDEAQNLKNPNAQRTRAARTLRADLKLALSGTPIENHPGELWSLFSVVFPTLLGSWDGFRRRFTLPADHSLDPRATEALARLIAPFLLRRTKPEVALELPSRTEVRVPVVLSRDEWQLYEDARLAALSDLETPRAIMRAQERRVEVLAALTRLRLLASHPRLYDERCRVPSSKLAALLRLVRSLHGRGLRTLIFSQFTSHLALVREALDRERFAYLYLDGHTPARERAARVHAFQRGEAALFLISLKAGGVGLNLTAATEVIHLDPWWNPAVEDQASDRAHRLGQEQPVTVYRLIAMGTIEEQMLGLHAQKRTLIDQVLRGASGDTATLPVDELLALLSGSHSSHGHDASALPGA